MTQVPQTTTKAIRHESARLMVKVVAKREMSRFTSACPNRVR